MKRILITLLASLAFCSCQESIDSISNRVFDLAQVQFRLMDSQISDNMVPCTYTPQGIFVQGTMEWWCGGFFPGSLWYVYKWTGNEEFREMAHKHTVKLADVAACCSGHDLGFQYWCSYGNGLLETGDESYKPTIEEAAAMLAGRFSPKVGCIRSWGDIHDMRNFLVIIDNMMNLELLMEASRLFNCDSLAEIANIHAKTTLANHFREDMTSYHVLEYSPLTGQVTKKRTAQGYNDESDWARGQAWGLYGYTMMYRETGDEDYLKAAQAIADVLIPMLPEDGVPYWDYDCPAIPYTCRDASSASIMCSALVELSTFSKGRRAKYYLKTAEKQIRSLASEEYLSVPGKNGGFLLRHSTGNLHGGPEKQIREVDAPLTYADYYFLEALIRYKAL